MAYLNIFKKKKNSGDKWLVVCFIFLFILFTIGKIIEGGYLIYTILFIVLLVGLLLLFKWLEIKNKSKPASLGSEFSKKYPIVTQYSPPKGINPAEAGLLFNLRVDSTDLTCLVYQWKFEGLIDVKKFTGEKSGTEYIKLIKKCEIPLTRPIFETEIFNSIFIMGNTKIIEGAFQLRYALMLEDLEFRGIKKGWIVRNYFSRGRNLLYKLLVALLFASIILYFTEFVALSPKFGFFILFLFFVCIFFGGFIDGGTGLKFTDKGAELASHLIGYRNFIKSCDENKIKLLLKDDPLFVDRTLPYATAFGLETEFLKKISPLKSDRSAKYVNGKKTLPGIGIIRLLFKSDEDNNY